MKLKYNICYFFQNVILVNEFWMMSEIMRKFNNKRV